MLFELFFRENETPRCPTAIIRRFVLWSLVCWVSAAPSFGLAITFGGTKGAARGSTAGFDPYAMATAIVLFSALYTLLTSTDAFDRFHRIRGMRRTLYIGYWTRIGMSIAFPITFFVDVMTGLYSIGAVNSVLGSQSGFGATFLITCLHGTIMNLLIALYMSIIFPIVRAMTKDKSRPGFEVILPAAAKASLPEAQIAQKRTQC